MSRMIPNMNGDSKETILKNYSDILFQLNRLIDSFVHIAPHGRNYQINKNPDVDLMADRQEYFDRLHSLCQIKNKLESDMIAISDRE